MSNGRNPDRLGDAIRELARTMIEQNKSRMELHVVTETTRAVYEIRLLRTVERNKRDRVRYLPRAADSIIEIEAFGPVPVATAAGSRLMVDIKKG